jgi:hypothetical protein
MTEAVTESNRKAKGTGFPVPLEYGARDPWAAVAGGWCRGAVDPPWGSQTGGGRFPVEPRKEWAASAVRCGPGVVIHE